MSSPPRARPPASALPSRPAIGWLLPGLAALALAGCSLLPSAPPAPADAQQWQALPLPGKALTRYTEEAKDGRWAIAADADRSASMWRRRFDPALPQVGEVSFSWWVPEMQDRANVADADSEDAAARVLFGFQGDVASLPRRTRMQFDLIEALTGEKPPYATLMYVWDATAPVGSVIVNPRSDRIRKIVLDSGSAELGRWRDHRRDLRADFILAFGEDPGPLTSVALMTDADNTRSRVRAWYGQVSLQPPAVLHPCTSSVQALSAETPRCGETPAPQPGTSPRKQP